MLSDNLNIYFMSQKAFFPNFTLIIKDSCNN